MSTTRATQLVDTISESHHIIEAFLRREDYEAPSFEHGLPGPMVFDEAVEGARQKMLEATDELHALMRGPVGLLTLPPHNLPISLHAICSYEIDRKIPLDSGAKISVGDLSRATGLREPVLRRIVRHAVANRLLKEEPVGFLCHTAASKLLATDPVLRNFAVNALQRWPESEEPIHSGFNIAKNTIRGFFDEIYLDPQRSKRYADAMAWSEPSRGRDLEALVKYNLWETVDNGTVVDVGGSAGSTAFSLISTYPKLHCVVQDRAEIVNGIENSGDDRSSRVKFMAHDFFELQPVTNADVYILRCVLHDWSDKYAIKILRGLLGPMKCGATLVIQDHIVDTHGLSTSAREKMLTFVLPRSTPTHADSA
ncbi:MAG: hypothetical protein Q9159_005947 [Coniocarpon cinnabarinum]